MEEGDEVNSLYHGIHQSVFMSAMMVSPSRDLPLCWDQHSKLLPGVDKYSPNDVSQWTMTDVAAFVSMLPGCKEIGPMFKEEVRNHTLIITCNCTSE